MRKEYEKEKRLSILMWILSFLICLFYIMLPHIQEKNLELKNNKIIKEALANEEYLERWLEDDWREE